MFRIAIFLKKKNQNINNKTKPFSTSNYSKDNM